MWLFVPALPLMVLTILLTGNMSNLGSAYCLILSVVFFPICLFAYIFLSLFSGFKTFRIISAPFRLVLFIVLTTIIFLVYELPFLPRLLIRCLRQWGKHGYIKKRTRKDLEKMFEGHKDLFEFVSDIFCFIPGVTNDYTKKLWWET